MAARRGVAEAPPPAESAAFEPADKPPPRTLFGLRPAVLLCASAAASASFALGYDVGVMSGAKRLVQRELQLPTPRLELLVGSLNLVSGLGGLASGALADGVGRRRAAAAACLATASGALLMAGARAYAPLLAGRLVTGVGVGACFHVAPLYLSEVAPRHVRGVLVSSFDLFINVGILAGFVAAWALRGAGWRLMLGLGGVPPALLLLALVRLPESPRHLVATRREREARAVLRAIYSDEEAEATFELLQEDARTHRALPSRASARRVLCPPAGAQRALVIAGLGVAFFQQATGVEAAVYYTPETLEAAGIDDEAMLLLATVGVGLIKVVFIIISAFLVESHGRVPLLLLSSAGIAFSQALIGLSFTLGGSCLFMAFFSIGSGPCSMMVAAECFPLQERCNTQLHAALWPAHSPRASPQVRGMGMGIATLVNRVTSGTIALCFLSLSSALTPAVTYYLFATIAVGACFFISSRVPETKGKALEEIEREMVERHLSSVAVKVGATAAPQLQPSQLPI
ncbi:hypothetical protein AB1Y20_019516 [Prymnesium parvum]|uniref:Major facilitator superfamily (MFS) profile domain-containing protein n=1 Tax=Prymnesium parvum TaxID=97485 RepID=A0AB34JRB9_PRYPA